MNNDYIIVNKTAIQKKIEELKKEYSEKAEISDDQWCSIIAGQIISLSQIISQSTPLIPEIENAYDKGSHNHHSQYTEEYDNLKQKDISKLKLDI